MSKTHGAEAIAPLIHAGQRVFGENRVQEAAAKWPALREAHGAIELHLVGQLQSNKADEAVQLFDCIHSLDRHSLVAALAMLQRQRGARTVYLVWGVIDIAFCLATLPLKMHVLPGALTFAVICALLYSPKSNAWFSPRKAANDACMTPA